MKYIFFDLDGTLADIKHRKHLVEGKKRDFASFEHPLNIAKDEPNQSLIELLNVLAAAKKYKIMLLSGRSSDARQATEDWLKQHGVVYDNLWMRPSKDYRPDEVLKKELLLSICKPEEVLCIFDDRNKVVDMWRSLGILCCQVADGDF